MNLVAVATLLLVFWNAQERTAQLIKTGGCPRVKVKQNFDLSRYLGTWYQYASFGTKLFQGEGRCVVARYSLNSTSGKVNVHNTQIPSGCTAGTSSLLGIGHRLSLLDHRLQLRGPAIRTHHCRLDPNQGSGPGAPEQAAAGG